MFAMSRCSGNPSVYIVNKSSGLQSIASVASQIEHGFELLCYGDVKDELHSQKPGTGFFKTDEEGRLLGLQSRRRQLWSIIRK